MNVVGSTIAREDDGGIYLHAGPEIGVASHEGVHEPGDRAGAADAARSADCATMSALQRARDRARRSTRSRSRSSDPRPRDARSRRSPSSSATATNFLFLGRGYNFPVALEGALKLKEISYIHAEGYPAAEMKHGPIALIDEDMPVVFIAPHDSVYDKVVTNMEEVRARGGRVIASRPRATSRSLDGHDRLRDPRSRETIDMLHPLLAAMPLQLLAYYIAVKRGLQRGPAAEPGEERDGGVSARSALTPR